MRVFKKHNVERITSKEDVAEKLIREGYKEVTVAPADVAEDTLNYDEMKVEELRELAKEKDIEGYSKMKKEELVAALEAAELPEDVN